jgi:hypothetical protein
LDTGLSSSDSGATLARVVRVLRRVEVDVEAVDGGAALPVRVERRGGMVVWVWDDG